MTREELLQLQVGDTVVCRFGNRRIPRQVIGLRRDPLVLVPIEFETASNSGSGRNRTMSADTMLRNYEVRSKRVPKDRARIEQESAAIQRALCRCGGHGSS